MVFVISIARRNRCEYFNHMLIAHYIHNLLPDELESAYDDFFGDEQLDVNVIVTILERMATQFQKNGSTPEFKFVQFGEFN